MKPCNNHKFGRIHLHFQSFLFNVLFNRENKPTAAKRSIFLTFIPKQFKMKQFLSFFVMLTLQSPFRQDCLIYLESFAFEPGLNLTECLFVYLCIKFIHDQPIQSLQNNEDSFIDFSDLSLTLSVLRHLINGILDGALVSDCASENSEGVVADILRKIRLNL